MTEYTPFGISKSVAVGKEVAGGEKVARVLHYWWLPFVIS